MTVENDDGALLELLRRLTPSDMSVLRATLDTPHSQIATVKNSPNDVLWSKMVECGLATEMTLDLDAPPPLQNFSPKSFALTAQGRTMLPKLLHRVGPENE
ncbi:MAG TPA: hypothetical protein VEK56_12475 [Vicinamibacterales bacterium]|nr:hypothetical protein [Vicinamibacterales bacterium]